MKEKFVIKSSKLEGLGCFAKENIRKGEIICLIKCEKINFQELKKRYANGKEKICNPLQMSEKEYLDLKKPYVYINHSCNPNAGIRKEGELFALKEIKKGQEITYDYSTTEWTYEKFGKYREWAMECNCRTIKCRGTLGQFPTLSPKLKKQYYKAGALQNFILRKLEMKMFS